MQGFDVLWVPGTDHAGIATQTVVERFLMQSEGKRRTDYTREQFLDKVWQWKSKYEQNILGQLKKLGSSCDWSRLAFTMDPPRSAAVTTMFKKLYDEGLIYQDNYLVNWDPITQTALADDEVEHEEKNGFLWHIRYPLENSAHSIIVATTRPETMLGDVAVAVSKDDPRYQDLIGKNVILPITGRIIPIIADMMVKPEFGTGAVKITPAHDPNDYDVGRRHNLPMINLMNPDGTMNGAAGQFEGLQMSIARVKVVEKLQELKLIEKIEPHINHVGISYRSKAVIEPYLSKQWFMRLSAFKGYLKQVVESDAITLLPKNQFEPTYNHWVENLRDWCISRQLWWGHRIPIWYKKSDKSQMICYIGEGSPPEIAGHESEWIQDEDVLDTWFSSALWPFSTMGWPEKTADMAKFYPNSLLITGHDILFFWVTRMLVMGKCALDTLPFPKTFLHGLIFGKSYWRSDITGNIHYISGEEKKRYDLGEKVPGDVHSRWEKMSKSKGNVVDPLDLMHDYGTDAVRLTLAAITTTARQIDLDLRKFEEFRNFTNKIWNGARFVFLNISDLTADELATGIDIQMLKLEDHWILSRLNARAKSMSESLEKCAFDDAAASAYQFFWDEFCAYYVEIAKPELFGKSGTPAERKNKQKLLTILLSNAMRLLHPFAPFITEEISEQLSAQFAEIKPNKEADSWTSDLITALSAAACAVAPYPTAQNGELLAGAEIDFAFMEKVVHAVRNLHASMKLHPGAPSDLYIASDESGAQMAEIKKNEALLRALVKLRTISYLATGSELPAGAIGMVQNIRLIVPLPEEMKEQERERLAKEEEKLTLWVTKTRLQLENEEFTSGAPAEVVRKMREKLTQQEEQLSLLIKKRSELS